MNIVIPMAGAGKRFSDAGYSVHKPAIMVTDRLTGLLKPMVVCATQDLPGVEISGKNVLYIDRYFHKEDGVEDVIRKYYPLASFITVEKLTEGQASTCLLAKREINNDEELLIAGCDNGMEIDEKKFNQEKSSCDVLVFTYRNNDSVLENPNSYGWVGVDQDNNVTNLSIKKPLSNNPMKDHAIVATFWFRKGSYFVEAAERMIREDDRINGEFYVDQVIAHCQQLGLKCKAFEVKRYIGWGTPKDYENYMKTISYWTAFVKACPFFKRQ